MFPGKKDKNLWISSCDCTPLLDETAWAKIRRSIFLCAVAANSENRLQFTHSNQGLIHTYPNKLLHECFLIWTFRLSLVIALFMLYICCAGVVSVFVRKTCTLKYDLQSYCIPKRNDRPLAKDLSESRLFSSEIVAEWEYAGQSTIYHCSAPHRKILHHQYWDYKQACSLLHFCCFFCLYSVWKQIQTCSTMFQ